MTYTKFSTCRATLVRCKSWVDVVFHAFCVFFFLRDQLVEQQKHLLRVKEMQGADWLICLSVSKFVA